MRRRTLGLLTITVALSLALMACDLARLLPTQEPTTMTVRLAPDGSGDYPSLEAAVDAVPPGSTIILEEGTYRLDAPLDIGKAIRLEGAGMLRTEIVSEAPDYVIRFSGEGPFHAKDIAFRHEGDLEANAVVVKDGQIDFVNCRFTGAVWTEDPAGRAGLRLEGSATGMVRECMVMENDAHGIRLVDQAQVTLEGNLCSENGYNGIVYRDSAGGVARDNSCSRNGLHGIDVYDKAQPTLERNICAGNEESGITYFGEAGGLARENECSGNGLHGIGLQGQARPTLEDNVCTGNLGSGIVYFDSSGGVARGNDCSGNGNHGIAVEAEGGPTLERNVCSRNTLNGINVRDEAQPTLEENVCSQNGQDGIMYAGSASGVARENKCTDNGLNGIEVQDKARPTLEANGCARNAQAGIGFSDSAGGVARGNDCSGNKWGIYVAETADPELIDNDCRDNASEDILDLRP
ncbi:MAG: hypothetical protein GTO63_31930 [Anaerolineae bacterium]|nr:hypothetical protein [Anaerolineae bacterium]NIQ82125.1 hypothetical protein [Anaerolineae bacterium]